MAAGHESYNIRTIRDSITRPNNATNYAAGDVISEVTTNDHFTFAGAGAPNQFTGTIRTAICTISSGVATAPDLELWLFDTDIAEVADNAAFAVTDAEILTLVGIIDFATGNFQIGLASGNQACIVRDVNIAYTTSTDRALYGQLVVRNTYNPVANEVYQIHLACQLD